MRELSGNSWMKTCRDPSELLLSGSVNQTGVMRNERRNLIRGMCKAAEDGSQWVWQRREEAAR